MKKVLLAVMLFSCLFLILGFVGCGNKGGNKKTTTTSKTTTRTNQTDPDGLLAVGNPVNPPPPPPAPGPAAWGASGLGRAPHRCRKITWGGAGRRGGGRCQEELLFSSSAWAAHPAPSA